MASPTSADTTTKLPLAVDLDDTLLRTDTLWESIFELLRTNPWFVFLLPVWLLQGKAAFKRHVTRLAPLDAASLPYNEVVLNYVRAAAAQGRPIALVTAADQAIANAVAAHLDITFDIVKGSDGIENLGGRAKAAWLRGTYPNGFEYIGDRKTDLPIWREAQRATSAGRHAARMHRQYLADHTDASALLDDGEPSAAPWRVWLSAMRVHQWSKNLLLLVPFVMAGKLMHVSDLFHVLLGMLAFSLLASATYLINDLLDLPNDRQHPTKSRRAFASSALTIPQGIAGVVVLLLVSSLIFIALGIPAFAQVSFFYALITLSYSFYFKREVLLDVMVLSGLYTLRITAGAIILSLPVSWWLVSFSFLFFLSLAFMKRYAELQLQQQNGKFKTGRNYLIEDMPLLRGLGVSASFGSVVLFIIYLILEHFSSQMFSAPSWLWPIAMIILLWQSRLWLLTNRGEMDQDPIYFAIKDRGSLKLGALCLLMIIMAW